MMIRSDRRIIKSSIDNYFWTRQKNRKLLIVWAVSTERTSFFFHPKTIIAFFCYFLIFIERMFNKLKSKWAVKSNFQFWLIFFIFAITGSSTLFVKRPVFDFLGFDPSTSWWIVIPVYLLTITPAYFVILLFYGTIFGQFKFFWEFEKKMFRSFNRKKK